MGTATIVALTAIIVLLVSFAFILLIGGPGKEQGDIHIHIDREQAERMNLIDDEGRINLDNLYDGLNRRRRDCDMATDIVNDTPLPEGSLDYKFWEEFSHIAQMSPSDRVACIRRLSDCGMIDGDADEMIARTEEYFREDDVRKKEESLKRRQLDAVRAMGGEGEGLPDLFSELQDGGYDAEEDAGDGINEVEEPEEGGTMDMYI